MKKIINKPGQPPSPGPNPARSKKISGGGSKKLQQMLGASESDIDLLLRPAEIVHTTSQRVNICMSICFLVFNQIFLVSVIVLIISKIILILTIQNLQNY